MICAPWKRPFDLGHWPNSRGGKWEMLQTMLATISIHEKKEKGEKTQNTSELRLRRHTRSRKREENEEMQEHESHAKTHNQMFKLILLQAKLWEFAWQPESDSDGEKVRSNQSGYIWVNYSNSLTWIKAILGWYPYKNHDYAGFGRRARSLWFMGLSRSGIKRGFLVFGATPVIIHF